MLVSKIKSMMLALALPGLFIQPADAKFSNCSTVSHYGVGDGYGYQRTANGERFDPYGHTAAHRSLPFGTRVQIVNPNNGKTVTVRINDRGPYIAGRTFDLSYGAFSKIASPSSGIARVCYSM
jgi:rare lipoprotein A